VKVRRRFLFGSVNARHRAVGASYRLAAVDAAPLPGRSHVDGFGGNEVDPPWPGTPSSFTLAISESGGIRY